MMKKQGEEDEDAKEQAVEEKSKQCIEEIKSEVNKMKYT